MKDKSDLKQGKVENKNFPTGKEPKESYSLKIQKYVEENTRKVMIVSGSIIVVTILFFVIKSVIEKNNEENKQLSALKISRVLPYYQQGDFRKALVGDPSKTIRGEKVLGLNEIIDKFGGTKQAKFAAIYAGNSLLSLNKPGEAIKYFEKALDSPANIVLEAANAGLAICNELNGKYKEAADYYEKASSISITPASKGKYAYFEALCREKLGDKEKADKLYREIIIENKSDYVGPSKSALARLGMIIEQYQN